MAIYLAAFFASFVLSILLTRWVRDLAFARNWVAAPASSRHLHDTPIPRIGGVAIYVSFLTVLGVVLVATRLLRWNLPVDQSTLLTILAPATLIFLVGLYDDLRPLSPYWKFAAQALAGLMLFAGGLQVVTLPLLFGSQALAWFLALPLTIFWVLLITNAFNLMDGLDGLAAGTALFATVTMYIIASKSDPPLLLVAVPTIILAGAILGFLRFNFNPATIFLGDSGSQLVGFLLSALAIVGNQKSATAVTVAVPVVSFMLPILDTVVSVVRRFINGQPLFGADREHIHHKLLQRGLSQRQVVGILYGVSAAFALLSLLLLSFGGRAIGVVLVAVAAVVWLVVQHLGYHEFFELKRVARRTVDQKQIMINNLAIRRGTESLATVRTLEELCEVLRQCFGENDFDGFRLSTP
ncbi:MAG: undecaprenyl/decaprenyl-phosphate alpha-N-acetylglucosaminyl 1-phosphate transferase, partial [Acidobacteria bacterium]|nr:undecaprenyl/decaprenyl-phosphate alpha-N-acetylglucosaminyl 1-phosphate transferase [Acidobacteriota bacterium]